MKRKGNSREVEYSKKIKEESFDLSNFSSLNWLVQEDKEKKIFVRLTPRMIEEEESLKLSNLPLSLRDPVIFDNNGKLWGNTQSLEGQYLSIKTHAGKIALSFSPFKGSEEIGIASGKKFKFIPNLHRSS
jgi:hypothetical protein